MARSIDIDMYVILYMLMYVEVILYMLVYVEVPEGDMNCFNCKLERFTSFEVCNHMVYIDIDIDIFIYIHIYISCYS